MYKTYTTQDLWNLIRKAYYGVIHWRWDAANGYYLNDDGRTGGTIWNSARKAMGKPVNRLSRAIGYE